MSFAPSVHTPEALNIEINRIHDDFDSARLCGSLGRAVIYGMLLGNPYHEYQIRGQDPLYLGSTARDIDLIGAGQIDASLYEPFQVDTTGFASPFLDIEKQGADWFLTASHHGFAEPLHDDVMRPIRGETVFGISSISLSPETLLNLYGIKGQPRGKDTRSQRLLHNACDALPPTDHLDDELFTPFIKLKLLNQASWHIRAQDMYRRSVPEPIRTKLIPIIRFAKKYMH
jgi:hypothetical protein